MPIRVDFLSNYKTFYSAAETSVTKAESDVLALGVHSGKAFAEYLQTKQVPADATTILIETIKAYELSEQLVAQMAKIKTLLPV